MNLNSIEVKKKRKKKRIDIHRLQKIHFGNKTA